MSIPMMTSKKVESHYKNHSLTVNDQAFIMFTCRSPLRGDCSNDTIEIK